MPNGAVFSAPEKQPPVKSSSDNPTPNFVNEKQRIKLLRELDLLDCDASEEAFDRITNMASRIFKVCFLSRSLSPSTLPFSDNCLSSFV